MCFDGHLKKKQFSKIYMPWAVEKEAANGVFFKEGCS